MASVLKVQRRQDRRRLCSRRCRIVAGRESRRAGAATAPLRFACRTPDRHCRPNSARRARRFDPTPTRCCSRSLPDISTSNQTECHVLVDDDGADARPPTSGLRGAGAALTPVARIPCRRCTHRVSVASVRRTARSGFVSVVTRTRSHPRQPEARHFFIGCGELMLFKCSVFGIPTRRAARSSIYRSGRRNSGRREKVLLFRKDSAAPRDFKLPRGNKDGRAPA